jgi:hypothetical protein
LESITGRNLTVCGRRAIFTSQTSHERCRENGLQDKLSPGKQQFVSVTELVVYVRIPTMLMLLGGDFLTH